MAIPAWTIEDQMDWELLRDADEATASAVARRRPDFVERMRVSAADLSPLPPAPDAFCDKDTYDSSCEPWCTACRPKQM